MQSYLLADEHTSSCLCWNTCRSRTKLGNKNKIWLIEKEIEYTRRVYKNTRIQEYKYID